MSIYDKLYGLIDVYETEIKLHKSAKKTFKAKNTVAHNVAESKEVSYTRVVEDLKNLLNSEEDE